MADDQRERVDPPPGGAVLPCGCGCTCGGTERAAGPADPVDAAADAGAQAAVVAEYLDPAQPDAFRIPCALDETPTGVPLVRLLSALDLPSLSAFDLTELAAAYLRVAGWAHAGLARAAAALHRTPNMPHPRLTDHQNRAEQLTMPLRATAMALSMRLNRSPQEMLALVREGLAYDHHLAATGRALADGRIAVPAARAVAASLGELPWQIAQAVEDRVLPRATDRTTGQVRRDVARALLEVDPEHAADRHAAAQASRMVTHPRALPDQLAEMRLVLPAPEAVAIDTVLESCARTARAAGDPRTLDQLRADGLTDLLLASPAGALPPIDRPDTHAPGGAPAGSAPGGTAAHAGASAATASTRTGASAPTTPARSRTTGPRDARTHVVVTVPLSTLLGQDEKPADLAGYGAIDATAARALALGGTWQRLVTDDLTGAVLDVGRTTYRPPAALAAHVRYRDSTCTGPGCSVPAARCELDHTKPWHPEPAATGEDPDPPGTTSDRNLGPVCTRHHHAKHELGLTLRQREPGVFDWTDPTGHVYRTRPGLDAPTEHLTAPRRVREARRGRGRPHHGGAVRPGTGTTDEAPPPSPWSTDEAPPF